MADAFFEIDAKAESIWLKYCSLQLRDLQWFWGSITDDEAREVLQQRNEDSLLLCSDEKTGSLVLCCYEPGAGYEEILFKFAPRFSLNFAHWCRLTAKKMMMQPVSRFKNCCPSLMYWCRYELVRRHRALSISHPDIPQTLVAYLKSHRFLLDEDC